MKKTGFSRLKRALNCHEKQNINRNYGLVVESSQPFKGGMRGNTVYANTNHGKRVVKIYPASFPLNVIDFQARACNHMNREGVPTPKVFANKRGNLVSLLDDTNYVVMDHLKGEYPSVTDPKIIPYVFEGLAMVLKSLSRFQYEKIFVIPELQENLGEMYSKFEQILSTRGECGIEKEIWQYKERLGALVEKVEERISKLKLPQQLILGDFNPESLLVSKGKTSGIVDFDNIRELYKGYDLMHSLDDLFINKNKGNVLLEERVNWEKIKEAMAFYFPLDPSIENEVVSFPLMYQMLAIRNILSTCVEAYTGLIDMHYLIKKKNIYIKQLEISTELEQRFVETLSLAFKSSKDT